MLIFSGWTRHIRTIHAQHMNFSCDKCPQKFYQKNALEQHCTRIHSKDEPKAEPVVHNKEHSAVDQGGGGTSST